MAAGFYADLFRPPGRPLGAGDPLYTAADVAPGPEEELLRTWWSEAAATDPGVVAPDARTLVRAPASVQAGLRALSGSRSFAGLAIRVMVADLKQVARYLSEPGLRADVRSRVSALIGQETAVVVAHSLGSVVAYEALCSLPGHRVRALVTLGSPLGIQGLITERLEPPPADGLGAWPGGPDLAWTNVADAGDVVALVKDLRPAFGPQVRGFLVNNGSHAHAVAGYDLVAAAVSRFTHAWGKDTGSGFVVLTSAQPSQQADAGAFPSLLSRAVHKQSTAGHAPPALDLGVIVQAMNDDDTRPAHQRIGWASVGLSGEIPAFLPNPRYDKRLNGVDLYVQQVAEWESQADRREVEYRRRFLVRAMGNQGLSGDWWFTGRHQALRDIAAWLASPALASPALASPALPGPGLMSPRPASPAPAPATRGAAPATAATPAPVTPAPATSALVLTAGPGSGKTAVLGLVASLADPRRRRTVPITALGLTAGELPPTGSVDAVIYAGGLTTAEVLAGMAAAARVTAATPGELVAALEGRPRPFTALVDALDEAADPDDLVSHLLRPLLDRGAGAVRLLLGTRPHLVRLLPASARQVRLDEDYADPAALRTYTIRGLLDAAPDSPYPYADPALVRAVAGQVAVAAGSSFLVARITSRTLAEDPRIPDPADPTWRAALPRLPADAIRRDLDRLGPDTQRARDLLRPPAYAEGQGLPWENIWAPLASQISGRPYTDEDILWLRKRAGSYIVEAADAGHSAYKLYHQAMAEHLREDTSDTDVHRAFVQVLTTRVPRAADGTRDWDRAHPYTLRNLATHAAAGLIDALITDMDYLTRADPDTLVPALHTATSEDARLTGAVYRASTHVHGHLAPQERRQFLAVDAARYQARAQLAATRTGLEWQPRWATGAQVTTALHATFTGHTGPVKAVACTVLDGRPVAVTGSDDGTVRVWDLGTGAAAAVLYFHDTVHALALAAEGPLVVGTGHEVVVFDYTPPAS